MVIYLRKFLILITIVFLLVAFTTSVEGKQEENSGKFKLNQGYYLKLANVDADGITATLQLTRGSNGKIIAQQIVHEGDILELEDNGKLIVDGEIHAVFYGQIYQAVQIDNLNQYHKIKGDVIFSDSRLTLIKPQTV